LTVGDTPRSAADGHLELRAEIVRLHKIIEALMNRVERSTSSQSSDFSMFQTTIMLEEEVRARTVELETALRENERIMRNLRESEAKFRVLVDQSLVGIAIVDDGKFTYTNAKFNQIYGYDAEEVKSLGPIDMAVESDRLLVAENVRRRMSREAKQVDYRVHGLRKNGDVIDVEIHGNTMELGGKVALISLVMDVTSPTRAEHELLALQERLREQTIHDELTGLYNRRYLEATLGRELIRADRDGHEVSVIMGDLDHFKDVNDRYGHLAGDQVLRVFGDLLKRHARASDVYCRYGGEEFLLVMPKMAEDGAVNRAEDLRTRIASAPVTFGDSAIPVTASFGVAVFPRDGRTSDQLIAASDRALYAAKAAGRNRVGVVPASSTGPETAIGS
jgi:diguanylate cyclase (GGDEF)-like protein/PAS domain S-box-containing protein